MTPPVRRGLAAVAVVPGVAILIQVALYLGTGTRAYVLLADVAEVAGVPGWYGAVSFAGLVGWLVAATAAGLAASLLPPGLRSRSALTGIAVLSVVLALDDRLQLHEGFARSTGLPELVAQGAYGAFALALAWRHTRDVRPEWPLFVIAGLGLGGSLVIDAAGDLLDLHPRGSAFLEDNAKLVGVVAWSAASLALARRALGSRAHLA